MRGAATPFDDKRISLLVRGMKAEFRVAAKVAFHQVAHQEVHDRAWRAAVVMAVCVADFLCFSEVSNVRLQDISATSTRK
jgi:hypothetical protein